VRRAQHDLAEARDDRVRRGRGPGFLGHAQGLEGPQKNSRSPRARQILVDNNSRCTQFIHSLSTGSILCRELPSNLNIRAFADQCPLVERGAQATATKQKDRRVQIFCLRESAITV
jgi:hypothetical protein